MYISGTYHLSAGQLYDTRLTETWQAVRRTGLPLALLVLAVTLLGWPGNTLKVAAILAAVILIGPFALPLGRPSLMVAAADPTPVHAVITERGCSFDRGLNRRSYTWQELKRATQNEDYILLSMSSEWAKAIPKTVLSAAQLDELTAFLGQLPARRPRWPRLISGVRFRA